MNRYKLVQSLAREVEERGDAGVLRVTVERDSERERERERETKGEWVRKRKEGDD